MKKLMSFVLAITTVFMTAVTPTLALSDSSKNSDSKPVECVFEPVSPLLRGSGDTWEFMGKVQFDVIGTEVERVYGYSNCTNSSGGDVYHYSRARYEKGSTYKGDTDRIWGYGKVEAITAWFEAFYVLFYTGRFYYGS